MNIESFFLSRKEFSAHYCRLPLDMECTPTDFEINFNSRLFADKTTLKLEINTTSESKIDILYELNIHFDDDEIFDKILDYFNHFSFKSFTPVFIPIVTSKRQILIKTHRSFPYSVFFDRNFRKLRLKFILDAPFLHPSWDYQLRQRRSTAQPMQPAGAKYFFDAEVIEFAKEISILPLQQFTYPFAIKSAFILTDHCDFDTEEKLRVFLYGDNNNGWLNRGLKITKGVFTLNSNYGEYKKSVSLEDKEYLELIKRLYDDGSEIAPHALKSSGQLNSDEFNTAIKRISNLFGPKTWIDHGSYIKYCYSQGGKENKNYLLVDVLKKHHFNNLWSFHDVNIDAWQTLNLFTGSKQFSWKTIMLLIKYFFLGKWLISAHYFRSIIHRNYSKNYISDYLMYAMGGTKKIFLNRKQNKNKLGTDIANYFKSLANFRSFRNCEPVPYNSSDVLRYASPLYTEDRRPLNQYRKGDLIMFYTFETTHLPDIYTKESLNKLVSEYGTHIGHTYILNDLPYINSIFRKKAKKYFLVSKWKIFLDILSAYVKNKLVWNATMNEYVDYITHLQNVIVNYLSYREIEILNNNNEDIVGYTFVIPKKFNKKIYCNDIVFTPQSTDHIYNFYIISLPGNKSINISY